jgi:hypothetical protein
MFKFKSKKAQAPAQAPSQIKTFLTFDKYFQLKHKPTWRISKNSSETPGAVDMSNQYKIKLQKRVILCSKNAWDNTFSTQKLHLKNARFSPHPASQNIHPHQINRQ